MNKSIRLLYAVSMVAALANPGHAKELQGPKKRIAVTSFKDKSNNSFHYWANVGDGMADMLTTALQKTGKFIVVERNQMSSAVEEQMLAKDTVPETRKMAQQVFDQAEASLKPFCPSGKSP